LKTITSTNIGIFLLGPMPEGCLNKGYWTAVKDQGRGTWATCGGSIAKRNTARANSSGLTVFAPATLAKENCPDRVPDEADQS
jgi:hypothetical protein